MPNTKTIYLATNNNKKIKELQLIIGDRFVVKSIADFGISWDETGSTFAENAEIKAHAVQKHIDANILADDSGLEVQFLKGAPGVYSSRYAGEDGNDAANNGKLLDALKSVPKGSRDARFVCCLCYLDESGNTKFFEGYCEGEIGTELKGQEGFGYDPLFYPKGDQRSLAEYSADEKNRISHRYKAIEKWLAFIS